MPNDTPNITIQYPGSSPVAYRNIEDIPDSTMREHLRTVLAKERLPQTENVRPLNFFEILMIIVGSYFMTRIFMPSLHYLKDLHLGPWLTRKSVRNKIAGLLNREFPYYQRLSEKDQKKFVRRVASFCRYRKFRFNEIKYSREKCYLISASAVQLTFGLRDFLLRDFTTINIINGEYRYYNYAMPFQGHTSEGEVFLSWPHFEEGYRNHQNGHNVGLHEMSHALTIQCFSSGYGGDLHFTRNFPRYSKIGRPLFARMQQGEQTLLGSYATLNYDEFWATSVEVFFEKPVQMSRELPELYKVMCLLLRQNPAATMG